jgi:hypothetical protein
VVTAVESMSSRFAQWISIFVLFGALTALAHLNSPDIYVEENAGPYPVDVIIRMPPAVPGSAEVQVLLKDHDIADRVEVWVREIPPEGEQRAPAWGRAAAIDENFFSKALPLMEIGIWRAQIRIKGKRGSGIVEVPVSARVAAPKAMSSSIAVLLVGLFALLYSSGYRMLVGLGRDAQRKSDEEVPRRAAGKARIFAVVCLTALSVYLAILAFAWYLAHINTRGGSLPSVTAQFRWQNPTTLEISVNDSDGRPRFDLQPDHGKMMHAFVIDVPKATYFFHLHPEQTAPGQFLLHLSSTQRGQYKVFADVLPSSGDGQTVTASLDVPSIPGASSTRDPDDSSSSQAAFGALPVDQKIFPIGDGRKIRWVDPPRLPLKKGEFHNLTFELIDADDKALGLQPYMGMDGHLVIMRSDAQMFAHVHPMGTLPGRMMPMADMTHSQKLQVSFPYGFPDAGLYRLWVQVKHDRVETGVFDVEVR